MAFLTADDGCLPALLEVPNGAVRVSRELAVTSTDMDLNYFTPIPADKLEALNTQCKACRIWCARPCA